MVNDPDDAMARATTAARTLWMSSGFAIDLGIKGTTDPGTHRRAWDATWVASAAAIKAAHDDATRDALTDICKALLDETDPW